MILSTEYFIPKFRADYLLAYFEHARDYCKVQGGDLVEIGSAEEEERVKKQFVATNIESTPNKRFWIGLSDKKKEGTFVWNSGKSLSYSNFMSGSPNGDPHNLHNCVYMSTEAEGRKWDDGWCLNAFPFICERPYKGIYHYTFN